MTAKTAVVVDVDLVSLILELVKVREAKSELANRESAIRKTVLDATGSMPVEIFDPATGEVLAEVVESERRSINNWDNFEATYPDAYEALVKFTDVLTLNTLKK